MIHSAVLCYCEHHIKYGEQGWNTDCCEEIREVTAKHAEHKGYKSVSNELEPPVPTNADI